MFRVLVLRAAAALAVFSSLLTPAAAQTQDAPYVLPTPWPEWMSGQSRFAVVDKTGRILFRGDPQHVLGNTEFRHGVLVFSSGGKSGLLDTSGKIVLPAQYEIISVLAPGAREAGAFVQVSTSGIGTCLDRSGKPLVPAKEGYRIFCPTEGLFPVVGPVDPATKKRMRGYLDGKGDVAIPLQFEDARLFRDGKAAAKQGGKWGVIDKTGAFVVPPTYDVMDRPFVQTSLLRVRQAGKAGYIDLAGQVVVPLEFEDLGASGFHEDRISAKKDGKWGYLDRSGKFAIPAAYDAASRFRNGLAEVKSGRNYGYIDTAGAKVIPIEYAFVQHGAGLVTATSRGLGSDRGHLFDAKGTEIPAPALARYPHRHIESANVLVISEDYLYGIRTDGLVGIADATGKVLAEPAFALLDGFRDGMAPAVRPSLIGRFAWRMDYGLLSGSGQFVQVPELGGMFGPWYESNDKMKGSNPELSLVGAVPGAAAVWAMGVSSVRTSWYGILLGVLVFPLLFGIWWVSAWRVALRHIAGVEVPYARAWRGMLVWILVAAVLGVLIASVSRGFFVELPEMIGENAAFVVFIALLILPLLVGIFFTSVHTRRPGRSLPPWLASVLAFLGFVMLSTLPFVAAVADVAWYASYWVPVVLVALVALSLALRKRNAVAAASLRELAIAGLVGWGVVLLWMLAANLYGAYI